MTDPDHTEADGGNLQEAKRETPVGGREDRVLVHHTYGRNSDVICRLLVSAGLRSETRPDVEALADAVRQGAAAAIIGADLLATGCEPLRTALDAQPIWSDLPVIVLGPSGQHAMSSEAIAEALGRRTAVKVLEQPARSFEVLSLVQAALRTRYRQYEIRDLLLRERDLRTELRNSQRDLQASQRELREVNRSLEERVSERTTQVRELSRALTRAEQQERRRISQVLHDELQQLLYGIRMKINIIRSDAEEGGLTDLIESAETADAWMGNAIAITRGLTVDLSPPTLKDEGLMETLDWLAAQMQDLHGLEVHIQADHPYRMPDEDMRVLLFQIVRELLFNVVKHADSRRATVKLSELDHHIQIEVIDEGRGFDPQEVAARGQEDKGFGLFSVRERLQLFDGRIEIESQLGAGTRVKLEVPVRLE